MHPPGRPTPNLLDLQETLDVAEPGDVIVLDVDATFTGNFMVPEKDGDGWIYVISSALDDLPEAERVTGEQPMPVIQSNSVQPALHFEPAAHHWRFAGIELTTTHDTTSATHYNVVLTGWSLDGGNAAQSQDDLPHQLIFDRCYVHGTDSGNVRTGIGLNAMHAAVIHSRLENFHEIGADSHS